MHPFPRPGGAHETVIAEVIAHASLSCASAPPGRRRGGDLVPGFRPPRRTPPGATCVCPYRGNNEPIPTLRYLFTYLWGVVTGQFEE